MRRRLFLAVLLAAALPGALPLAQAPEPGRVYRLGILSLSASPGDSLRRVAFPELARQGFVEGRNLVVLERSGTPDRLPEVAREFVDARLDIVVAAGLEAVHAAKAASATLPIVMSFSGEDPVAAGWARSLARPGGNVTGLYLAGEQLDGKRLQLLHEAVPAARRIAVLSGRPPRHDASVHEIQKLASGLGLELILNHADRQDEYPPAFERMRSAKSEALIILSSTDFYRDRMILAQRALEAGLPSACGFAHSARSGCLIGYGPSISAMQRRTADYVARILRGAAPGELPIEHLSEFEFVVNLKTAKALGVAIPPAILLRADEVVE